jgi:hypothetical protein
MCYPALPFQRQIKAMNIKPGELAEIRSGYLLITNHNLLESKLN